MTPEEKLKVIKDLIQTIPEYTGTDQVAKEMDNGLNEIIDIIDEKEE